MKTDNATQRIVSEDMVLECPICGEKDQAHTHEHNTEKLEYVFIPNEVSYVRQRNAETVESIISINKGDNGTKTNIS